MVDGAVVASFVGGVFVLIVAVGGAYRGLRDNIDDTKDSLGKKIDAQTAGINKNAENIANISGNMTSMEQIRQACMTRFQLIEDDNDATKKHVAQLEEKLNRKSRRRKTSGA
jgi:chromosome segregation ATPase